MLSDIERVFRKTELFSKEEVLKSFDMMIEFINNDDGYTEKMKAKKLELCHKFKKAIEGAVLPILKEDCWFYGYVFNRDSIELHLLCCSDIELEDDGESISSMTIDEEKVLISIKCEYLSIEQYAEMQNVTPNTVKKWIHNGKLHYAKKIEDNWLIPALSNRPTRSHPLVYYYWDKLPEEATNKFPFLLMGTCLSIHQDWDNKNKLECTLTDGGSSFDIELDKQEIGQLEFALISSDGVRVDVMEAICMPLIDK